MRIMKSAFPALLIACIAAVFFCGTTGTMQAGEGDDVCRFRSERTTVARLLIMDVPVRDDTLRLCFDTGSLGLILDSLAAASIFNLDSLSSICNTAYNSVYFPAFSEFLPLKIYSYPVDIPFSRDTLYYNSFMVYSGLEDRLGCDGIMSIPKGDSHIWDIDFEKYTISVSNADSLMVEGYDFTTGLERFGEHFHFKAFPLAFTGSQDSVTFSMDLLVDTGNGGNSILFSCPEDKYTAEREFIQENAMWSFETKRGIEYLVNEAGWINDTLQVEFRPEIISDVPVVGMDLLTRFRIMLDMSADKAYFFRNDIGDITEFLAGCDPDQARALALLPDKSMTTAIVTSIGKNNCAYKAGLRKYDLIEKFDGGTFQDFHSKFQQMKIYDSEYEYVFDIDRFGEKMQIKFFWESLTEKSDSAGTAGDK